MADIDNTPRAQGSDELTGSDFATRAFDGKRDTEKRLFLRLAWLPIPFLLIAMMVLGSADLGGSHESSHLLLALNFTFSTLVSLFVAYLIGRSYLVRSTPGLLALGCGVVFWGAAFVLAALGPANPNFTATVHNLGVWLSAGCNLAGAALLFRSRRNLPTAGLWLGWAYTLALGAVGFIALGAHAGWTPVFFVQGQGGTPLRQLVLGSAVIMFALAAILLRVAKGKPASSFAHWYPYALGLMAVGLLGVLIQSSLGSWLSWTGRAAQYLGGVYMLIAAIASVRESHGWRISLEAALRESEERFRIAQELSPDGFTILRPVRDAQGRVVDFTWVYENAAVARMNGTDPNAVLGRRLLEVFPGHRGTQFLQAYQQVAETGQQCIFEAEYKAEKLPTSWFRIAVVPAGSDIAILSQDITERKRAEEALQRQADLLRLSVDAIIVWQLGGVIESWNYGAELLYGYNESEALGRLTHELLKTVHPVPWAEIESRLREFGQWEGELRDFTKEGREVVVSARKQLMRGADGVERVLETNRDITAHKRAEEGLRQRQSETVFATLADFVPQMVWMCMPDGLNIYFNQRWVEYTGLTLEESYGRGWNTPFHPDDKQAAWEAWNHAVQSGEEYRVESRLRAADGRYRWFLMRGAPLRSAAGEIVRWFGTCTDIEQLKQAGQTLLVAQRKLTETVVNQLPCCVALVRGRDMTFQLVNPGYQAISPGQEMLGQSLQVVWPERPGFEEVCRRVLETGVSYEAVDEPAMVSRSGGPAESAYFSWSMNRVNLPGEDGWGLLITGWETTGRKLAEQALLRSEKLSSVGRMAATIAHEINNPLGAVTNLLFLAGSVNDLPESARQYLEMADTELKRIAHITRQSLGFYRESNAPVLMSVNAVLESAVDLLKSRITKKRAVIEKQCDEDVEFTAVAGELRQVFSNLLANSLDAIDEEGTIKVRVSTGPAFKNGNRCVRVTIADNGRGISADFREHLFEPFFTTKGTVGTGLGLWVSKQIIDKHKGFIRVRSSINREHRGTVFSIVLPIEPAAQAHSQSAGV